MNINECKEKYPEGTKVSCKVLNIQPFGAFVEITETVHGLINVPELIFPEDSKTNYPEDYPQVGEIIDAYILWYSPDNQVKLTQKPENHERLNKSRE